MIINVTDSLSRAEYVDIIAFDLHLLDTTPPPIMEEYKRGDMIGKLRTLLLYIRDHASAYIYGKHYTGVSIDKLRAEYGGGSVATWEKYIHLWIEWKLLGAPDHSVSKNNIFELNAMEYARLTANETGRKQNATTMYTVTRWTADVIQNIKRVKGSGRKADAIHRRGKEEADKIWGDKRGRSRAVELAEMAILSRIKTEISRKGYCTRGDLRQRVCVTRENADGSETRIKIDPVFEDMRSEIDRRYYYGAPSKEQRERWNIGRQYIIMRYEDAPERATSARGGAVITP